MLFLYLSMAETESDKVKIEQLYEEYRLLMHFVADNILKDDLLAEDAVHDAFISIIENLKMINNVYSSRTKSFVVLIVKNKAINIYNYRKRHLSEVIDDYENKISFEIDYSDVLEESDVLGHAIAKLDCIYRDVLKMKFVYGLSYHDISEVLKISEMAVRKRVERAKRKIKEGLELV